MPFPGFAQDIYPHTVKCLMYIFNTVRMGCALCSKVMFALKQLCASRNDQKHYVGNRAIPHLIEGLTDHDTDMNQEFVYQSLLLLIMLSGLSTNCELMYKEGLVPVLEQLSNHPSAKRSDGFQARVSILLHSMSDIAAADNP